VPRPRQALHFLRSALGPEILENRGDEELGVRPGSLWCDAAAFQAAVEAGQLQDALDLYRNDLLPGFFVAEAPEFERWVELERERLRRLRGFRSHRSTSFTLALYQFMNNEISRLKVR